ncbi:ankyrin repeat-containing domain protein [Staphylotrichum tortipilum]|uniref:Ankyrin repeat-containing domain protein n=1 Tax=Staphylotrichum tortipilum TaxID=2831512 RepID=A0AAN6RX42_9PEZI|nr:ankyrin repeat-containing domain protein [Staphylotrichum longicolle]
MASLGALPPEVFNLILDLVDDGAGSDGTLAAVAATCCGFYKLAMPFLYHHVVDRHPALLHWCAQFDRVATARRLVDAGAPVDVAMQWISREGDFDGICGGLAPREMYQYFQQDMAKNTRSILLCRTAGLRHSRPFWFPIHLAARSGNLEMVQLLVGAQPSTMKAPSALLCRCPATDAVSPCRPTPDNTDLCLPFHIALCHGHPAVATWFLEHGSPPWATLKHVDVLDHRGLSPLWHAYLGAHWAAVDLLLARGANVDDDLGNGYTPLIDASLRSNHERVLELIARGVDVNTALFATPHRIREELTILGFRIQAARPIDAWCWTPRRSSRQTLPLELLPDTPSQTWRPTPSENWAQYNHEMEMRRTVVSKLLGAGAHLTPAKAVCPPPLVAAAANQ